MRPLVAVALILAAGCSGPRKTENGSALSPAAQAKVPEEYRVNFDTTKGKFVVVVTRAWAPKGADRFHRLVRDGFYDGARFYRVRPKFVVQWGIAADPAMNSLWKQLKITDDPVTQSNGRGFITFATDGPDTRTTELYINLVDNKRLDSRGFAPFGRVVEGMDVVDSVYGEYGEVQPRGSGVDPERYAAQGDSYIQQSYPKLDQIKTARLVQ